MIYRVLSLSAVAGAILFCNGCGPANEENLGSAKSEVVPHKPGDPDYTSFGEMMQKKAAEAAKNKGAKGASTPKK
jgi:hypothetical protein